MTNEFNLSHFSSFKGRDGKKYQIDELKNYLDQENENVEIKEKLNIGDVVALKGRDYTVTINNVDYEIDGVGKVDYTGVRKGQRDNRLYFFNQNEIDKVISRSNEDNTKDNTKNNEIEEDER